MRALAILIVSQLFCCPVLGVTVSVGDQVVLKGKPKGVPFHSQAASSMKGRIPSATQVGLKALHSNNWLEIEKHDDETGFIKKKYVLGVVGDATSSPPGSVVNPTSLQGLPTTASSFSTAKKRMYGKVYHDRQVTFYSGCDYEKKKPKLTACGYDSSNRPQAHRATRTEAEHITPASWFGQNRPCWRTNLCSGGKNNRACCEKIDHAFRTAHNDLHNLTPAIGQINALRSNHPYGLTSGEDRDFGSCDFEFKNNQAEPKPDIRGNVARVYFYMEATYGFTASPQTRSLLVTWHQQDPVDSAETSLNNRIKSIQANGNLFVEAIQSP